MDYLNIIAVLVMCVFTIYWIYTHRTPNKLIYILFAAIPIFSGNFELSFFRPVYQSLLILILILNIKYWIKENMKLTAVSFFLFGYLILILISYIDNNIINSHFIAALINFIMIMSTLFYIYRKINTKVKIYKLLDFIAYLSLVLGGFSILEKILIGGRTEVTFTNPNYLAFSLGIGFVWMLVYSKSQWKYLNLIILVMGIFATESRIVILSIILLSFVYFFKSFKKKSFYKILPVYLIFGIIVLFIFQNFSESRFGTDMAVNSDAERTAILAVSLNIMKKEPWNGIGYGQFIDKFDEYLPYGNPAVYALYRRDQIVTHNDYLRIIDELGLPAFLLFMAFVGYVYFKNIRKGNVFLYLFTYILIFSAAHNNMNALMFWFFLLLPIHYLSLEKIERYRALSEDT